MPDNNNGTIQASESFIEWFLKTYPVELPNGVSLGVDEVNDGSWRESKAWDDPNFVALMQQVSKNDSTYYKFWNDKIWQPPAEPAPSAKKPEPSFPKVMNIGGNMMDIKKYTPVDRIKEVNTGYDKAVLQALLKGEEPPEKPPDSYITLYAPVIDAEFLSDEAMQDIYKNIYGMLENGQLYKGGAAISSEELVDVFPYDPLTQTSDKKYLSEKGLKDLKEIVSKASYRQAAEQKFGALGEKSEKLIEEAAIAYSEGKSQGIENLLSQIERNTPAWQIAHPEEERARLNKQYPISPVQETQNREALFSRFNKPDEQFATEVDRLSGTVNEYQSLYDKYKPMQAQLSNDAESQYASTIISLYENAQNMLQQIKGKGTITTTGYTEAGQKMTGERPYQIGQHTPSESATLASVAGNLGVPANQIAAMGQKYITDTEHPDFKNLTQSEKQELLKAGNVTMNQSSSEAQSEQQAQQQSEWDNLLKKAKAVNYPQRKVRL